MQFSFLLIKDKYTLIDFSHIERDNILQPSMNFQVDNLEKYTIHEYCLDIR